MWQRRPTKSDEALSRGLTWLYYIIDTRCRFTLYAAVAQLVEFQISNLAVAGSSPVCRSNHDIFMINTINVDN